LVAVVRLERTLNRV